MDKELVVVGKDIIESLTVSMYEDSRFIYREYIQNSADQIDKAIADKICCKEDAAIYIQISKENKQIIIEDNATGVPASQVSPILRNIAQSTKERGVNKGFRGIGRLGGLAYCEKLIFETSAKGEKIKSTLIWDAKKLKQIINNRAVKEEAAEVVEQVTELRTDLEEENSHYFKVILENVTNSSLLEVDVIEDYLTFVAPLPFARRFIFATEVYKELKSENLFLDEYKIYLNQDELFKSYSADIYDLKEKQKIKIGNFFQLEFFKEYDKKGQLLFWGWFGLSEVYQQLKDVNKGRGIRLRKNNIQVGDENTLNKLHRESRGNMYFIGEIHAFHPDLIPNSRRDYFSENDILEEFEQKVKDLFHLVLHPLYYGASELNTIVRRIEEANKVSIDYQNKQKENSFISPEHKAEYQSKVEKTKNDAKKNLERLQSIEKKLPEKSQAYKEVYERIKQRLPSVESTSIEKIEIDNKSSFRANKLSKLSGKEQKFVSKILEIVRQVVADKKLAENLISKIEDEFK